MILESIVTSISTSGEVNIAPMGPTVEESPSVSDPASGRFLLRPFKTSRTYRNVIGSRRAAIHITDNVELIAHAAVDALGPPESQEALVRSVGNDQWRVLCDCHRWFAVEVESVTEDDLRATMECKIVDSGTVRPFWGLNRAKFAVLEAAIVATRTHLLSADTISFELNRLQPLIDKTAGTIEREAFEFLRKTIDERLAASQ